MNLLEPRIKSKRADETADTMSTIRFRRKQRLIQQLEDARNDGRDPQDVIRALVLYIDDPYVTHLVRRVQSEQ